MTRLCLTASDLALAAGEECDHLGPWSMPDVERFAWKPARRPFDGRLAEAAAFTHAAGDWLAAEWASRLNTRHNRAHPASYWALILRAWLTTLVDLSFDKYLRLRERRLQPRRVSVWPASSGFPIADTRDFLIGSEQEPLNRFIMSRLAQPIGAKAWTVEEGAALARPEKTAAIRRKECVLEARRWLALGTTAGRVHFYNVPGVGALGALTLSAASRRRPLMPAASRALPALPEPAAGRAAAEATFAAAGFGDAVEAGRLLDLLDALSSELLPANMSSGYEAAERASRRRAALTPRWVDTIVCGPSLGGDDEAKFYFAWMRAYRGCRLIVNQHGGMYGLLETYSFVEQTDYRSSDRFLSWGWREQTGCDVTAVPASSPALGRLVWKPVAAGKVILVTTNVPSYNARIDSAVFADDAADYRQAQLTFAAALQSTAADRFWLRPYGRTSTLERTLWDARRPGTRVLAGPLDPELERSALVVVDHPGTTMCLTLAAGIPTILFWDPEIWRMGRAAQPFVQALRDASILHDTPTSAAVHVNRTLGDIAQWWNDAATRRAREAFAAEYCRASARWRAEWAGLFGDRGSPIFADA